MFTDTMTVVIHIVRETMVRIGVWFSFCIADIHFGFIISWAKNKVFNGKSCLSLLSREQLAMKHGSL
jgi:hypothetical protein